jgi:hypothetical protein
MKIAVRKRPHLNTLSIVTRPWTGCAFAQTSFGLIRADTSQKKNLPQNKRLRRKANVYMTTLIMLIKSLF